MACTIGLYGWYLCLVLTTWMELHMWFTQSCLFFQISPNTNGILSAEENSLADFIFKLKWTNCTRINGHDLYITVTKDKVNECSIRHVGGKCSLPVGTSACMCTDEQGVYRFARRVNRSDDGVWKWAAFAGIVARTEKTVPFHITYRAQVTAMSVNGQFDPGPHFVSQNQSVTVTCFWENGKPPTTIRLVDRHGEVLSSGNWTGNITYTYSFLGCYDNEEIRCVADKPQSNNYRRATIFVQCPPIFGNTSVSVVTVLKGGSAEATFPLYALSVTDCQLRKSSNKQITIDRFATGHSDFVLQCDVFYHNPRIGRPGRNGLNSTYGHASSLRENKCWCNLMGREPYTNLSVHIKEVTEEYSGVWRISVINEFGTDEAELLIQLSNESEENGVTVILIITGSIAFVLGAIITMVFCRKRDTALVYENKLSSIHQEMIVYRNINPDGNQTQQSSSIYEEILDSPTMDRTNVSKSETGTPLHSTDGYLHAVSVSPDDSVSSSDDYLHAANVVTHRLPEYEERSHYDDVFVDSDITQS